MQRLWTKVFKDEHGNKASLEAWAGFECFTLQLLTRSLIHTGFGCTYRTEEEALTALNALHLIFPRTGTFEEVH